jgi:hypothetical protein
MSAEGRSDDDELVDEESDVAGAAKPMCPGGGLSRGTAMTYTAKLKLTFWARIPPLRRQRNVGRSGGDLDIWLALRDLCQPLPNLTGRGAMTLWEQIELTSELTGRKR